MKKVFRTRSLVTCNEAHEVFDDAFLAVDGSKIVDLGPWKKRPRSFRVEETGNSLMMPGLLNLHTHLPMTMFRGLAEDVELQTWLEKFIFPVEKKFLSPSFVKLGTELAACELIRNGTTYVADMYFYENEIAKVLDQAGLRGLLGQSFFDAGGFDSKNLEESFERAKKLKKQLKNHSRLAAALAPHAPYTCSLESLRATADLAKEERLPIHIHIAETKKELADLKRQTGFSPVRILKETGILEAPFVLSAHSIWLEDHDFSIFKDHAMTAVINPQSNAKLGSGIAPVRKFLSNQVSFAFGTDGAASNNRVDIFSEMNLMAKLYRLKEAEMASFTCAQILDRATRLAAKAVGEGHRIGSLEPEKEADFILLDLKSPHLQPFTNAYHHLIYSAAASDVHSVYVAGRCLMKNRKLKTLQESKIFREVDKVWKKVADFLKQNR